MRIAQVSPLYESVPPQSYGGTERVVSYLTEELVSRGHEVTLFASGDSLTTARLVPICDQSLRLGRQVHDSLVYHYLALEQVIRLRSDFDVIHFHVDYMHFPLSRHCHLPQLTTLHGRLDLPELNDLYTEFCDMPVVSISGAQRIPLPRARWIATVHHGLPVHLCKLEEQPGGYFAFLGRVSPEKGLPAAIEIATRLNQRLKVAAKIDRADQEYFSTTISPLLDNPLVEFIGEICEKEKQEFLGGAIALLAPVDWPEPFGLVLIEAMACGTPIIAFDRGSVPEVIEHEITGFIVANTDEAIDAARRLPQISRRRCRETFERRFTADRMATDYERVYDQLLSQDSVAMAASFTAD